jgi:hypothetical protein
MGVTVHVWVIPYMLESIYNDAFLFFSLAMRGGDLRFIIPINNHESFRCCNYSLFRGMYGRWQGILV